MWGHLGLRRQDPDGSRGGLAFKAFASFNSRIERNKEEESVGSKTPGSPKTGSRREPLQHLHPPSLIKTTNFI